MSSEKKNSSIAKGSDAPVDSIFHQLVYKSDPDLKSPVLDSPCYELQILNNQFVELRPCRQLQEREGSLQAEASGQPGSARKSSGCVQVYRSKMALTLS